MSLLIHAALVVADYAGQMRRGYESDTRLICLAKLDLVGLETAVRVSAVVTLVRRVRGDFSFIVASLGLPSGRPAIHGPSGSVPDRAPRG